MKKKNTKEAHQYEKKRTAAKAEAKSGGIVVIKLTVYTGDWV